MNENEKFTRLTVEQQDCKIIYELSYDDINTEDLLQGLKTLMIGMSFSENTIYKGMVDFLSDNCADKYEIIKKESQYE